MFGYLIKLQQIRQKRSSILYVFARGLRGVFMRSQRAYPGWVCLVVAGVCASLVGCSTKVKTKELTSAEKNIQSFHKLYMEYRQEKKGPPPRTADEIKAWASKQPKDKLAKWGVDDIEKAFVSPRDNKPYTLVNLPMGMGPVLAHETDGVGGKRILVNSQGTIIEVAEKEFQELMKSVPGGGPAGPRPGPPR